MYNQQVANDDWIPQQIETSTKSQDWSELLTIHILENDRTTTMLHVLIAGGALIYAGVKFLKVLEETKVKPPPATTQALTIDSPSDAKNDLAVVETVTETAVVEEDIYDLAKKNADKEFNITSASFGLIIAGTLLFPPLMLLGLGGLAYQTIPIWRKGYQAVFKKHEINMSVLDSIALPGIFLTGHFVIAGAAYWLYALSQKLLLETEDHSRKSLISAFGQNPKNVWLLREGVEIEIPFDALRAGDVVVVNAGEIIPADGTIIDGVASVDQHMLTGESQPAEKVVGDKVFAATISLSGRIHVQVEKAGQDTTAAQIAHILVSTIDFKSSVQSRGQQIADKSVLPTLITSGLALPVAGPMGAIAVMLSCPGDGVRIISPLTVLNFLRIASKQSILIKDGRALELLSSVDTVVFDKTGTLTQEQPHIGKLYPIHCSEDELLGYAAAAEYKQTHPIARAILHAAKQRNLVLPAIDDAQYEIGYGIKVKIADKIVCVGSARFMDMEHIAIPDAMTQTITTLRDAGYSFIMVAVDGHLAGMLELHATIRPEAKQVIRELKQRQLSIYIISGDHELPTRQLANELGIEHYFADTLPENKADIIEKLQQEGKVVCFVGDGINDSIALKKANVSISLSGASTIATDTAQIVLMDASLNHLNQVFELANQLKSNLHVGLLTAVVPGLTIVGGVFLLNMGVIGALVILNVGLVAGVINAALPLFKTDTTAKGRSTQDKPKT